MKPFPITVSAWEIFGVFNTATFILSMKETQVLFIFTGHYMFINCSPLSDFD
jgi:hypothetical protein